MPKVDNFFSLRNTVNKISNDELEQAFDYLEPIRAFARTTNKSLYVIDYQTRGFESTFPIIREVEILRLSVRGFTISEIAEQIFLSVDTIKRYT